MYVAEIVLGGVDTALAAEAKTAKEKKILAVPHESCGVTGLWKILAT